MRVVLGLVFIVLCGVALSQASSQSQSNAIPSETEQRGTEKSPITVRVLPAPDALDTVARDEAYRREKSEEDRKLVNATIALAAITGALALFTGGLWLATYSLGRDAKRTAKRQAEEMQRSLTIAAESAEAARKQAEVSREEFIYAHRPRVVIRREQVRCSQAQRGINFVLANTGNLVATNIVANINIRVIPASEQAAFELQSLPPYGDMWIDVGNLIGVPGRGNRTNLMAGERAFIFIESADINEQSMVLIKRGERVLYFFGLVNFDDPGGTRRESAFFRMYRALPDKFEAKDDPDYERT